MSTRNKQQLDTLRRMGIETVGQLASANTIIGKSIPVGDNRIQRLRNALKAYDNDRKLKGAYSKQSSFINVAKILC
jgi:predicted RecB family nuclease